MNNSKQSSIILGAVVAALLGTLSGILAVQNPGNTALGMLPCMLWIIAAALTVWHYTNTHKVSIKPGEGASMGAMALGLGGLISGVLSYVLQMIGVTPSNEEIRAQAIEQARKAYEEQGMSPEQIEQAIGMVESSMGFMSNPILGIVMGIVFSVIIGAIVGAVAAAIFKKGRTEEI
jgi:hypothetical protein